MSPEERAEWDRQMHEDFVRLTDQSEYEKAESIRKENESGNKAGLCMLILLLIILFLAFLPCIIEICFNLVGRLVYGVDFQ